MIGVGADADGPTGSITGNIPLGIVSARRLPIPGAMSTAAAASCTSLMTGHRTGPEVISNGEGS